MEKYLVDIRKYRTFAKKITLMAITIISAKQFARNLKATIQKSGKLGFTEEFANVLDFASKKYAKFARDDENGVLYLVIINNEEEDAFQIKLSGKYYYVPAKLMFDMLGFDYKNNTIIFDLIRQFSLDEELQGQVFKMLPRINKRKEKDDEIENK